MAFLAGLSRAHSRNDDGRLESDCKPEHLGATFVAGRHAPSIFDHGDYYFYPVEPFEEAFVEIEDFLKLLETLDASEYFLVL